MLIFSLKIPFPSLRAFTLVLSCLFPAGLERSLHLHRDHDRPYARSMWDILKKKRHNFGLCSAMYLARLVPSRRAGFPVNGRSALTALKIKYLATSKTVSAKPSPGTRRNCPEQRKTFPLYPLMPEFTVLPRSRFRRARRPFVK